MKANHIHGNQMLDNYNDNNNDAQRNYTLSYTD